MKIMMFGRSRFALWLLAGLTAVQLAMPVEAQQAAQLEARVSKVIDGDTFTLKGVSRHIRVWGLDAPERGDPGGPAATSALRGLISGVTLHSDLRDIDRYGRYVGQCFLGDGRDIAAVMIQMGVATEYCRYSGGYYGTC
jgi:micrococcal nuclease